MCSTFIFNIDENNKLILNFSSSGNLNLESSGVLNVINVSAILVVHIGGQLIQFLGIFFKYLFFLNFTVSDPINGFGFYRNEILQRQTVLAVCYFGEVILIVYNVKIFYFIDRFKKKPKPYKNILNAIYTI